MPEPVILEAIRTPFGKRGGAFRDVRPDSLLAHVLRSLLDRVAIEPASIDDVICGTVTQTSEQGANVGRLGALLAGMPVEVPAVTLNRMCGSSQQAIHFAAQSIAAGDARYVIGCGVESMTRVPMLLDIEPSGQFRGFGMLNPALREHYELIHQGESAERLAAKYGIPRDELDAFAIESHRRAAVSTGIAGRRDVVPVAGVDANGTAMLLANDEGVRRTLDPLKIAGLSAPFRPGTGVVTAGNSSQISDGAAAVLIGDESVAKADGIPVRARFRARVVVGSDPTLQLDGPIEATRRALKRAGMTMRDIDWIEINEAFACVVLAWARAISPDMEKVNPWGGAIAHGHPLGATGAGLMAKMLAGLETFNGTVGLQAMCIGHGMATATIIERA
ncbi:MAG: thiolase family protein [Betaproteobacteria bacterium]|nr:thiolase family protein [Betaproteobacteria bacterium]